MGIQSYQIDDLLTGSTSSERSTSQLSQSENIASPGNYRSSLDSIRAMENSRGQVLLAGLAVDEFSNVQERPQFYSIGHNEPVDGPRMTVTGPTSDMPTAWTQVMGTLARTDSRWNMASVNNLHEAIDRIIQTANEKGPLSEIVFRAHGYPGAITIGETDYNLSNADVQAEFARLRTSGALKPNAQIEFQGCNVAAGVDQLYSDARDGLQAIANITGAAVEGSPNEQRANRFGFTGQVVRFAPQR